MRLGDSATGSTAGPVGPPDRDVRPAKRAPVVVAAAAGLGVLLLTAALLRDPTLLGWDNGLQALVSPQPGAAGAAVQACVLIGQRGLIAPLALGVAGWLALRDRRLGPLLSLLGCLVAVGVVTTLLKNVVGRSAPAAGANMLHAGGQSYPSGHTAGAVTVYGVLALLLTAPAAPLAARARPLLLTAAGLLGALAGAGVVLRGYHWVSDSVAGYLIGIVAVALAARAIPGGSGQSGDSQVRVQPPPNSR